MPHQVTAQHVKIWTKDTPATFYAFQNRLGQTSHEKVRIQSSAPKIPVHTKQCLAQAWKICFSSFSTISPQVATSSPEAMTTILARDLLVGFPRRSVYMETAAIKDNCLGSPTHQTDWSPNTRNAGITQPPNDIQQELPRGVIFKCKLQWKFARPKQLWTLGTHFTQDEQTVAEE